MISLIWAQTKNGVIGKNNALPWNIKEEMQHFIDYTRNKTILMGRKTWDGLLKKPLKNRINLVATSKNINLEAFEQTYVINDLVSLLKEWQNKDEELVIIGGLEIFKISLPFVKKLVKSIIYNNYDGDVIFDDINYDEFNLVTSTSFEEFEIKEYERK